MIFYSHFFDLLAKLGTAVLAFLGFVHFHDENAPDWQGFLWFGALVVVLYGALFRTLGSMAYCWIRLGACVSFSQALRLNPLLAPVPFGDWYPFKEVADLVRSERVNALMRAAAEIKSAAAEKHEVGSTLIGEKPLAWRAVRWMLYPLMIAGVFAGMLEIPPFDMLAAFQERFLDDEYFVMLINCVVGGVIPGAILRAMDASAGVATDE